METQERFLHSDLGGNQANIKIKTLPEVRNSFLFSPKSELSQALAKSQSRSSKRLANLRKLVPDVRLILKIINLMIFAQLGKVGRHSKTGK